MAKEMPVADEVLQRSADIRPLLAGLGPLKQGAILADLVSIWVAGHLPAESRQEVFDLWCATMWELVPLSEAEIKNREIVKNLGEVLE